MCWFCVFVVVCCCVCVVVSVFSDEFEVWFCVVVVCLNWFKLVCLLVLLLCVYMCLVCDVVFL